MNSKLAALLKKHKAQPVKPDMNKLKDGASDARDALGISHFPQEKSVVCLVFQNADRGPEEKFWETRDEPQSDLNQLSLNAALDPSEANLNRFDLEHYNEFSAAPTRPTMSPTMAMAFCIEGQGTFEKLALSASRAFLKDAEKANASELSLTLFYMPGVKANATMAFEHPYQMTFTPAQNPVRIMPQVSAQERAAEPELFGEMGQKAWDVVQNVLKTNGVKYKPS